MLESSPTYPRAAMRMKSLGFYLLVSVVLASGALPGVAAAQGDDTLRLMREPTAFTDVIDAFDDDDAFDANLHVGFERRRTAGTIQRERGTGTARDSANWTDIGEWEHVRNELVLGADIGVYRDLMIFARLPLVLSDTREVLYPDDVGPAAVDMELQEPAVTGDAALYEMPFVSPTRSGIDTFNLGTAFNLLNQARRPQFPTWMMLFEFRLGVGDIMNACEKGDMDCDAGVSRGTHAFRFESRMSRRYRYAEVYSGLLFHFEWAGRADGKFSPSGSLAGYQNVRPPIQGTFTAGIAFIPWENRQSWQRFSVDLRLSGTYVSEGRDYSGLFDALGSSQHPALAIENLEGRPDPASGSINNLRRVPFTGLTDVQAHGKIGGTVAIEMQAARYVRFRFGLDVQYITEHVITFADGCNPSADVDGPTDNRRACILNRDNSANVDEGLLNPHHRPVIDRAGNRFRLDGAVDLNLFVGASAQF